MICFRIIYIFLIIQIWEVFSITTRSTGQNPHVRNFRHTSPPLSLDWELGLREAVHQALLREHHTDPGLRDQLLEAPLIGRQDTASPFGDIAVLARGQLYDTPGGFKFVQDTDHDNCNDCHHNSGCARSHCQPWKNLGHHKLLALWTVKRIRHRDPNYGHVFEIEYTISPITAAINEELVKHHGYFNYNIPGHIFVIKSDPHLHSGYPYPNADKPEEEKWYKKHPNRQYNDYVQDKGNGHFKSGILIGVSPDGYKQVLHSFPGFYSSYHPQTNYHDQTTIDPKEYELYKKLIESLAAKTTSHQAPHRFAVTKIKEKSTSPPTQPTYHKITTFVPVPQATLMEITEGQLVSLTRTTLPSITTTQDLYTVTPVKFRTSDQFHLTKYSEPDFFFRTSPMPTKLPTLEPAKPIKVPVTIHYFAPEEETETSPATTATPTDNFDIFSVPTKPMITTKKKFTLSRKTTKPTITQEEEVDLSPINTSTEPMKPVTQIPQKMYPDSINEQLPPPDKDTETTIPYVSSTVTQPSTIKIEKAATTITTKSTVPTITSTKSEEVTFSKLIPTTEKLKTTVVIEKIPYVEKTTTIAETTFSTDKTLTTGRPVFEQEKVTTTEQIQPTTVSITKEYPTTISEKSISTIPTTQLSTSFTTAKNGENVIILEKFPTTLTIPTTVSTTTYSKPTTIVEYSFDSTTKEFTEPTGTQSFAKTTPTVYYPTTSPLSTQTEKYTTPIIATHYFYTFDTDQPTTTITTERTTTQFGETEKSTTVNTIRPTIKDQENTITQLTTRKYQKPPSSSQTNDFLVDSEGGPTTNSISNSRKDIDEDDIFGKPPPKSSTEPPESTTKKAFTQSDLAKALFGNRRSKQIKLSSKITNPVTNAPKIIYSNFYAPSTETPTSNRVPESTQNIFYDTTYPDRTSDFRPSTDQSYITSVSVEIHKKENHTNSMALQLEPTIRARMSKVLNTYGDYDIYKAEFPQEMGEVSKTTERNKIETKTVFDNFALQLVNHARSIDYLSSKKPSRQPKYKRRSYTPKSRRSRKQKQ